MAETILAKMAVQISANAAEMTRTLNKASSDLTGFRNNVASLAGSIAVAFGVSQIAEFGFEVSKLAGEAKGVGAAFNKLPESVVFMEKLKLATGDTVSELDLMKRTVQATNFGISLEALPKLLEFASVRAQQTGQSVDYLVDSIVTGIGRKSPLILDNLGISAVSLKKQLNGVSLEASSIGDVAEAVGRIANEELTKMGGLSKTTATDIAELSAAWDNFKVSLGTGLNATGALSGTLGFITDIIKDFSGENKLFNAVSSLGTAFNAGQKDATGFLLTIEELEKEFGKGNLAITAADLEKITKNMSSAATVTELLKNRLEELGIKIIGLNDIKLGPNPIVNWIPTALPQQIQTLESLRLKLKELNDQFESTDENDKKKLSNIGKEIIAIQLQIEELEKLRKKQEQIGSPTTSFGKEQANNAQAGKETKFTDFSQTGTPTGLPSLFPDTTEQANAQIENIKRVDETEAEWAERRRLRFEQQMEEQAAAAQAAADYGTAVGDALGSALSGQQKFSDAMRRLTADLLKLFLQRALAGIISSAATSGGPPPVAIALAAAGVAAISAMFAKIGAPSKSVGGSLPKGQTSSGRSAFNRQIANEQIILVGGEFKLKGNDLVVALDKANKTKQRTG